MVKPTQGHFDLPSKLKQETVDGVDYAEVEMVMPKDFQEGRYTLKSVEASENYRKPFEKVAPNVAPAISNSAFYRNETFESFIKRGIDVSIDVVNIDG